MLREFRVPTPGNAPMEWTQKLEALRRLPALTWAGELSIPNTPAPGKFLEARGRRFLVTRSGGIDGVILGVAPRRSSCLVAIEIPGDVAIAAIADSPAVLDTFVKDVFAVLGDGFAIVSP